MKRESGELGEWKRGLHNNPSVEWNVILFPFVRIPFSYSHSKGVKNVRRLEI